MPSLGRSAAGLPLVDIVLAGEGRAWSGPRYCESVAGRRMRYAGHEEGSRRGRLAPAPGVPGRPGHRAARRGLLPDPGGPGAPALLGPADARGHRPGDGRIGDLVPVRRPGGGPSGSRDGSDDLADLDVLWARTTGWPRAAGSAARSRDALPDLNRRRARRRPAGLVRLHQRGHLVLGHATCRWARSSTGAPATRWVWQIEHNGGWHWQVGECARRSGRERADGRAPPPGAVSGAYLALLGPTDAEHHWRSPLAPGESLHHRARPPSPSARTGFDGAIGRR